ncbi:MAG TPA: PAS domain S-box protein [Sphingomicrobium sp.]|nr:PAS domain S-box protein [Sphingomicrobium sp.]
MDPMQLLLQKVLDSVVVMRIDGTIADWNGCAEHTFGWTRAEALDKSMGDLIVPPQHRAAHLAGIKRYLETGTGPVMDQRIEITALHRSGREFPIELSITEAQFGGETVFIGFLRDISDRRAAEIALRDSEARLAATYNHALVGIGEVDRSGRFSNANEQLSVITGYSLDELRTRTFLDITHPDDVEEDRRLFEQQWSGELDKYQREKRYVRKDGSIIWIELAASIVRGVGGASTYGVRIVRDITDRRRAEEHQRLLFAELNHRVKNSLAVVQGLAHQTFRPDQVPPELMRTFEGRLTALSAAHDLLMKQSWESTPIASVIEAALRPFETGEKRVGASGEEVLLSPSATVSLALGLHELATNAAKYGALSNGTGAVEVEWRVDGGDFELVWTERGGPPVEPPARKGFGTRLLQRAVAQDLGGAVELDFDPGGLVCTMRTRLECIRG